MLYEVSLAQKPRETRSKWRWTVRYMKQFSHPPGIIRNQLRQRATTKSGSYNGKTDSRSAARATRVSESVEQPHTAATVHSFHEGSLQQHNGAPRMTCTGSAVPEATHPPKSHTKMRPLCRLDSTNETAGTAALRLLPCCSIVPRHVSPHLPTAARPSLRALFSPETASARWLSRRAPGRRRRPLRWAAASTRRPLAQPRSTSPPPPRERTPPPAPWSRPPPSPPPRHLRHSP